VVWTEKEIHIERLEPDLSFWTNISEEAANFHEMAIMPEFVGKFYSRKDKPSPLKNAFNTYTDQNVMITTSKITLYCICQQPKTPDKPWSHVTNRTVDMSGF